MPEVFNLSSTTTISRVPGTELTLELVGIAKPIGQVAQPYADAILEERQALFVPMLVVLHELGDFGGERRGALGQAQGRARGLLARQDARFDM